MEKLHRMMWLIGISMATAALENSLALLFVATFYAPTLCPINSILQWIDFSMTASYSFFLLFVVFHDPLPLSNLFFTIHFVTLGKK